MTFGKYIFGLIIICTSLSLNNFAFAEGKDWFEGGTLQEQTIKEWRAATYHNKTASAASMALVFANIKSALVETGNMELLKLPAVELAICIDVISGGVISEDSDVAKIAGICGGMFGWK